MSDTKTIAELVVMARREASMYDTGAGPAGPCSDTDVAAYLNDGLKNLWDEESLSGGEWCTRSTTLSTVAGTAYVELPSDCYRPRVVRCMYDAVRSYTLKREDIARVYDVQSVQGRPYCYATVNEDFTQRLQLGPVPDAVYSVPLLYHRKCPTLVGDGTFDFVSGWYRYVTYYAAGRMLMQEGDIRAAQVRDLAADAEMQRIKALLVRPDVGDAPVRRCIDGDDGYGVGLWRRDLWP